METRFWWVRHAPVINPDRVHYGQLDWDCRVDDAPSFDGLGAALPEGAVWLTTPLMRTGKTAEAIQQAAGIGIAPVLEPDLIEQHFGDWQGRPQEEVHNRLGPKHPFWAAPSATRIPGGESFDDLIGRVRPTLDRLRAEHAGRDVVIVAHGGTIRAALAVALGIKGDIALQFSIANLSLTRIDRVGGETGAWRVVWVNRPPAPPQI